MVEMIVIFSKVIHEHNTYYYDAAAGNRPDHYIKRLEDLHAILVV